MSREMQVAAAMQDVTDRVRKIQNQHGEAIAVLETAADISRLSLDDVETRGARIRGARDAIYEANNLCSTLLGDCERIEAELRSIAGCA